MLMWSAYRDYRRQRRRLFYPKADLPVLLQTGEPMIPASLAAQIAGKALGRPPDEVRRLPDNGTFHVLFRACWDDGTKAIVRFNALSGQHRDFPMLLDAWAMAVLRSRGLPALQVLEVDLSRHLCPWDFEVLEEAPGRSLRDLDHDDEQLCPLLTDLGRMTASLHQIPAEQFGFLALDSLSCHPQVPPRGLWPRWGDYLTQNLDDHVRACRALGVIEGSEATRIQDLFARRAPDLDCAPRLLHGDLGNHNVFGDQGRVTALIDWEDCLAGDPIFEIAFWATFHPDRRHEAFLQGYREVQVLPADFDERFWLYYLRIALAKTVLRQRLGLRDPPGRPLASTRIQKALKEFNSRPRMSLPILGMHPQDSRCSFWGLGEPCSNA